MIALGTRRWQLGDIGQGAVELVDRTSLFRPPAPSPSIVTAAPSTVREPDEPIEAEPDEPSSREYICATCQQKFRAGKRGKLPKECPDHRPRRGRVQRRKLPVSRTARSLAQALLSAVESGVLVWKTGLGDYLVMRDGREYHGDSLAVALARSTTEAGDA